MSHPDRETAIGLMRRWVFTRQDRQFPGMYDPEILRRLGEEIRRRDAQTFARIGARINEYLDEVADLMSQGEKRGTRLALKRMAAAAMFLHYDCMTHLLKPSAQMLVEAMRCLREANYPPAVLREAVNWIQDLGILNWKEEDEKEKQRAQQAPEPERFSPVVEEKKEATGYLFPSYHEYVSSEYPKMLKANGDPKVAIAKVGEEWRQLRERGLVPPLRLDKTYRPPIISLCTNLESIATNAQLAHYIPHQWNDEWNRMSADGEIPGVEWYTSDEGNLRPDTQFNAQQQSMVDLADEEVKRGPKPENAFLAVRGIHGPQEWQAGEVIVPRPDRLHSASFSLDDVTASYVDYVYDDVTYQTVLGSGCCICEIIIPRGADIGSHTHENQVIFPKGASFLVLQGRHPKIWEPFGQDDVTGTYSLIYLSGDWQECLQ